MLRKSLLHHLMRRDHRIVIPASLTNHHAPPAVGSDNHTRRFDTPYNSPSHEIADLIEDAGSEELRSRVQLHEFRGAVSKQNESIWRDSRSHNRKQEKLIETYGVEGAVRETLQPSKISFSKELKSRPLDRKILEEIYRGLHGLRVERKLKRGVSWEHWISKGDGTAPVFNTAQKTQQTFGYGGKLNVIARAKHESQFPNPPDKRGGRSKVQTSPISAVPEIAFIGRTNTGKSSLVNALLNSMICPYGQLQGTTTSCNFISVAGKMMLVDLPGYGYYNPLAASQLDAENAIRVCKEYIAQAGENHPNKRNVKRVFVCISSRGMQHMDIKYLELLETNRIPFSVVITKSDQAPIRQLARIADYTRCQLVHYKFCKEMFLSSALRLAGIDKIQDMVASVALDKPPEEDALDMDFDRIV